MQCRVTYLGTQSWRWDLGLEMSLTLALSWNSVIYIWLLSRIYCIQNIYFSMPDPYISHSNFPWLPDIHTPWQQWRVPWREKSPELSGPAWWHLESVIRPGSPARLGFAVISSCRTGSETVDRGAVCRGEAVAFSSAALCRVGRLGARPRVPAGDFHVVAPRGSFHVLVSFSSCFLFFTFPTHCSFIHSFIQFIYLFICKQRRKLEDF